MASVTGATSTTFGYDAVGRRVSLTTGGATRQFRYDGGNVEEERDGTGAVTGSQLGGLMLDEVYERIGSGGVRAPVVDALGSVLAEFDSAGGVTGQYSYGPFGQTTTTGATSLPQQWTGRERDTSTGLYYHRARYYSPTFGRFLSEDPLEFGAGDVNLHAYAFSDPTNLTDPTGEIVPVLLASCARGALQDAGWQIVANMSGRKSVATLDGVGWALVGGCVDGLVGDAFGYAFKYGFKYMMAAKSVRLPLPSNARSTNNPHEIYRRLERYHGVDSNTASDRLHQIKQQAGLGGADDVRLDLTGNVYDQAGNWLGSLAQGGARRGR